MKSILVATDFSNGAEKAIKYAKKLAILRERKLVYLHVVNLPIVDPAITSNVVAETVDELKNSACEELEEMVKKDKLEGINSEYRVSFNDILGLIKETGETTEVSMVVVGRSGNRTFLDRVLGSTAEALINNISYPLLVIPEEFTGEILSKMCYASRLKHDEVKFVKEAAEWRKLSANDLTICHVLKEQNDEVKHREREFESELGDIDYDFKYCYADNYRTGIIDFLTKESISMLFVTSHKRGFFEGFIDPSLTKQVINAVQVPVMIYNFEMGQ